MCCEILNLVQTFPDVSAEDEHLTSAALRDALALFLWQMIEIPLPTHP